MFSDDPDKTVFRQPSIDPDRTVIRESNPAGRTSTISGEPQPKPQPKPLPAFRAQSYAESVIKPRTHITEANTTRLSCSINILLIVASNLITMFDKIRQTPSHDNIGGLHQSLVNDIKIFEVNAKNSGINSETVLLARYVMCVALDEAVLNTSWGSDSKWNQRTLLSIFHNETSGGEKLFLILDRMREEPSANLDFLEFMFVLLSLGYSGKYGVIDGGRDTLDQIRNDLYRIIRSLRVDNERSLSPSWHGLGNTGNTLKKYLPVKIIGIVILAVFIVSYSGLSLWMQQSSAPLVKQLHGISTNMSSSVYKSPVFDTTHEAVPSE